MSTPIVAPAKLAQEHVAEPSMRKAARCAMVILGAGGDLTRRKLMPALAHLACDGLLDQESIIIGVGRDNYTDDSWRAAMGDALKHSDEIKVTDGPALDKFLGMLRFVRGDLKAADTYKSVTQRVSEFEGVDDSEAGRLIYLAIPPSLYPDAAKRVSESGLVPRTVRDDKKWARIVIEKPFGRDLDSARSLDKLLLSLFSEQQIYRIDHYLGKETVQNILVLRFANSIFEPVWNRNYVHHVQITAAETVGVEHRASYYEESGVIRDMFQNHLMQLLTLTAMEPPNAFDADAVRGEKAKVLGAIHPVAPEDADDISVIGQYDAGEVGGEHVIAYREEPGVAKDSRVPTYAAIRFTVDNWRWHGVPFFLRSGKRLAKHATEIAVQFKEPPHSLFRTREGQSLEHNVLVMRIQPDEGISLRFEVKVPGVDVQMAPVRMVFNYADAYAATTQHPAYETLLLDCMLGDATLFARWDEVEASWRIIDPIIEGWKNPGLIKLPNYTSGTWGPSAADTLIARDDAAWREP